MNASTLATPSTTDTAAPAAVPTPNRRRTRWLRGVAVAVVGAAVLTLAGVVGWHVSAVDHPDAPAAPYTAYVQGGAAAARAGAAVDADAPRVLTRDVAVGEPIAAALPTDQRSDITPTTVARRALPAGHRVTADDVAERPLDGAQFVLTVPTSQVPGGLVYGQYLRVIGATPQPFTAQVAAVRPLAANVTALTLSTGETVQAITATIARAGDVHLIGLPG